MTMFKAGLRAMTMAISAATIAGCAIQMTGGPGQPPASPAAAAARAAEIGHYQQATRDYMRASRQASRPADLRRYRLQAGLAAAQGGDIQTARRLLSNIEPATLDKTDRARYNLAQREIASADLSPEQALGALPRPARNTPPAVAQRVWEKRADLHFANSEPVAGIQALVQREVWLMSDRAMRANDNRIYDESRDAIGLGIGPGSRAAADAGQTTRGWLALAQIGQSQFANRADRDQALAHWQSQYPGHPANRSVLTDRFDYAGATQVKQPAGGGLADMANAPGPASDQIAIALPINGRFQNAAQAIRDGFMFAYHNKNDGLPQPIVYASGSMTPEQLMSKAQSDNVGVLVGPLGKSKVAAMSRLASPMPEIALNSVDQGSQRPGFYQFGLSPGDEAKSAAMYARRAGYSRALALVPSGDWGSRVLDAFRAAFTARGGQLVDYQSYDGNSHDHSRAIKAVLAHYDSGDAERSDGSEKSNATNGAHANIDFIFVAAQPTQARLIRSQLKYYHAADLLMITTSHAFSGTHNPAQDIDLNGVRFVDMPWLLGHNGTIERLRSEAADAYGKQATSYARLFAMGMDAWLLARRDEHGGLAKASGPIEGMTGVLAVQPDGHIKRYLGWAVFRNGLPQTVSMPSIGDADTGAGFFSQQNPPADGASPSSMSSPPTGGPDF